MQVAAFRSLRGYTSIEVLKGFSEKDCSRVFSFYAGGWNRDGLAIDAIGYLLREEAEKTGHKQLLLVLTDGNPNDSAPMPPVSAKMTRSGYGTFSTRSGNTFESRSDHGNNSAGQDGNTARDDKSDGSFFGLIGGGNREYQGPAAVQDTADSVKKLRDSHGSDFSRRNLSPRKRARNLWSGLRTNPKDRAAERRGGDAASSRAAEGGCIKNIRPYKMRIVEVKVYAE